MFAADPLKALPATEHDYVLESLMQFVQMQKDPSWFINTYALEQQDVTEIIQALDRAVQTHLDGGPQLDDQTAIVVKRCTA